MTVWAGIDIGNATIEVVLCRAGTELEVLASARTPTRGGKGSVRAVQGAAQLVRRLADRHGLTVDRAAFAPTRPVHSSVGRVQLQAQRTGRLAIATRSAATTAGDAAGVGVPVPVDCLDTADPERPVIVCGRPAAPASQWRAWVDRSRRTCPVNRRLVRSRPARRRLRSRRAYPAHTLAATAAPAVSLSW